MSFRRHRLRFLTVPPLLLAALLLSDGARAAAAALAVFWDVHHSSAQTFGLGRIYDRLHGNDPRTGRALDLGLNWLLYGGPLVAGLSFVPHAAAFYHFGAVGSESLAALPERLREWHLPAALAVLGRRSRSPQRAVPQPLTASIWYQ
jgi:hypothetical protein